MKEVKIGDQIWMLENLNVDCFRNGDSIPQVKNAKEWTIAGENKQPAWCYYKNDVKEGQKYGKLYNWYAVNDERGLAPEGWHVPTDLEWKSISDLFGGEYTSGIKMKNTEGWPTGRNGNNLTGFSGLPGGYRIFNGKFENVDYQGYWWCADECSDKYVWLRFLVYNFDSLSRNYGSKSNGYSVRCIKD
jgi:uncharacterized protein (TIGR02145 family)